MAAESKWLIEISCRELMKFRPNILLPFFTISTGQPSADNSVDGSSSSKEQVPIVWMTLPE